VSTSSDQRLARGRGGEAAALRTYVERGYRPVARNWRCGIGELDLVLERDDLLVFCEVKTRRGSLLGGGYEAVTISKQRKLRRLAEAFLLGEHPSHARVRFDVASVWLADGRPEVEVFEDAF